MLLDAAGVVLHPRIKHCYAKQVGDHGLQHFDVSQICRLKAKCFKCLLAEVITSRSFGT